LFAQVCVSIDWYHSSMPTIVKEIFGFISLAIGKQANKEN
jgi:hypothetical protein